jgi:hypothetical protein
VSSRARGREHDETAISRTIRASLALTTRKKRESVCGKRKPSGAIEDEQNGALAHDVPLVRQVSMSRWIKESWPQGRKVGLEPPDLHSVNLPRIQKRRT